MSERIPPVSTMPTWEGFELLSSHAVGITENDLKRIPAYRAYVPAVRGTATATTGGSEPSQDESALNPIEQIDSGVRRLRADVAARVLNRLRASEPDFLE